jgi:hypothetical protein
MFIDENLRRVLVGTAEKLEISESMLLDWASTLEEDRARRQKRRISKCCS